MKTKLAIDLANILEQKYPHGFHVPTDIDLSLFLEFGDDDWMHELDVKRLLADDGRIAIILDTDDVQSVRPELNDDQAWEILQQLEAAREDCQEAMLEKIRDLADSAYPTGKTSFRERLKRLAKEIEDLPDHERDDPAAYGQTAAKLDAIGCDAFDQSIKIDLQPKPGANECQTIDIHKLLEERRQVAVIWSVEDVQSVRSDLSDDQAWQVLQRCWRVHDCEIGFNWFLIKHVADDLFPSTKEGDGQ